MTSNLTRSYIFFKILFRYFSFNIPDPKLNNRVPNLWFKFKWFIFVHPERSKTYWGTRNHINVLHSDKFGSNNKHNLY